MVDEREKDWHILKMLQMLALAYISYTMTLEHEKNSLHFSMAFQVIPFYGFSPITEKRPIEFHALMSAMKAENTESRTVN